MRRRADQWLQRRSLPHEAALTVTVKRSCPNAATCRTCAKHVYVSDLSRSAASERPHLPKAFLRSAGFSRAIGLHRVGCQGPTFCSDPLCYAEESSTRVASRASDASSRLRELESCDCRVAGCES